MMASRDVALYTVGIGKSPAMGGTTLAELEAELRRVRETYNAPDTAAIAPVAPGSIYMVEVIWIGPASG
jgi:hypothetical protein